MGKFETLLHIFIGLGVFGVRAHHPSMVLLGELNHSRFVLEPLLQNLCDASICFDVLVVVSSCIQKGRGFNFLG